MTWKFVVSSLKPAISPAVLARTAVMHSFKMEWTNPDFLARYNFEYRSRDVRDVRSTYCGEQSDPVSKPRARDEV